MKPRHIVFATAGSLGDLYPFLALAEGMRQRGHRVSIATSRNYRELVGAAGFGFHHMRPDPGGSAAFYARYMHPKSGAEFVYREYLAPAIRDSHADLTAATRDADLLVSQSLMALAAPLVAAQTGISWISAVFQPMTLFSVHERPNYLPYPLLPGLCERYPEVHARVFHYVKKHTLEWVRPVLELRRELGLASDAHPMYEGQHSPSRVMAMFSPMLGGPQADWPRAAIQTGTALYAPAAEAPGAELQAFLARGPAPLLVFTQSSAPDEPGNFYGDALQVAAALGARALLVTSGLAASAARLPDPLPEWAMRLQYAAFEEVFPHAAAVVHAGGIGTAFKALRAGTPQILIPHAHDQIDNAMRLARLGAASVIARKAAGRRSLEAALRQALDGSRMRQVAAALASRARAEDGVTRACEVMEAQLQQA
jgi:UDP:flavonoid glycosyltransferase YjiC (YdhE family)